MTQLTSLRFLIIESVRKIAGAALASAANAFTDAGHPTGNDAAIMIMLAAIFVVLVGAMLTPAVCWAWRQPLVRRVIAWAVRFGIRWLLWRVIRWLLFPQPLE